MAELIETPSTAADSGEKAASLEKVFAALDRLTIWRAAWIVFFVSVGVSVLLTYVARPLLNIEAPLGGEGYDGYIELAENLAHGHGYVFEPGGHKVFHRPPLYPALLVPGIFLPESWWRLYVAALNAALFAAAGVVVFHLARSMLNRKIAWGAWAVFSTNPFMLWSAKNAVSPICQTLAYVLILYCAWIFFCRTKLRERISLRFHAGFVASLFAGAMSHGTMLAVAALVLGTLGLWGAWRRSWRTLGSAMAMAVVLAALIAPWTWRNYKATGMFIPVAGNSGLAYFAGNAHWGITLPPCGRFEERHAAEIRHIGLPVEDTKTLVKYYGFSSPEAEQFANARLKEHARNHPADLAKKIFWNALEYYWPIVYCLFPPEGTGHSQVNMLVRLQYSNIDTIPLSLYNLLLVTAAVAGFACLWRRGARLAAGLLLLGWAAFAIPYFPFLTFVGHGLYNFGTIPVLAICAAAFMLRRHLNPIAPAK